MKPKRANLCEPAADAERSEDERGARVSGFTVVELLAMLFVMVLITSALTPALSKTRPNSRAMQCQSNLRQLGVAWSMYAGDHADLVANNFGVVETLATMQAGRLENWANNVMTWGTSGSATDRSNTNAVWVTNGVFGRYLGNSASVYHCPSDNYVSPAQAAVGWTARVRSVSMNSVFGRFSSGADSTSSGLNWAFPQYAQYLKLATVPKPARTWLLIEEHPDSINDGYFVNTPTASAWQDIPASFHDGGCSTSFADGHAEMKRWQSSASWYRVQFYYPSTRAFDSLGRIDFAWYLSRTGYPDAKTGAPQFNY
jgi:prepilin-type processing-associated H-X9-DG protein